MEFELFQQMDQEREAQRCSEWISEGNTGPPPPRLIQDDELPDWLAEDVTVQMERTANQYKYGRGQRKRAEVKYNDDSLTESQWLERAERGDLPMQRAAKNASSDEEVIDEENEVEGDENGEVDVEGDGEVANEYNAEVSNADQNTNEPLPSKPLRIQIPSAGPSSEDKSSNMKRGGSKKRKAPSELHDVPVVSSKLKKHYKKIWKLLQRAKDYSSGKERLRSEIFMDLPESNDYHFKNPISMNMINEKIENDTYTDPQEFYDDFTLMFKNAKTLKDSIVNQDASVLEQIFLFEYKSRFVTSKKKKQKSNSDDSSE